MESQKVSATHLMVSLLGSEKKEIGIILTYGLGVGILSLAVPVGVQTLVNTIGFGAINQPVLFLVFAVFLGLAAAGFLRGIQVLMVELLQKRFFTVVALELAYRIPRVKIETRSQQKFPELVNRFFDVLTVQKSGATLLLEGFALALQIILGLLLLAFYHWFLLAFAILLVIGVSIILFVLGRGAVDTAIEESVQKYRVAAWLEELAARPLLFRSADARELALQRADEVVGAYLNARAEHFRILLRQVIGSLTLQAIASSGLLGIGAWLVVRNQLTLGQLVAAEIVVTTALGSLAKFQKHLEAFYDLVAALDKLEGLMDLPLEREVEERLPVTSGPVGIELRSVGFEYEEGEPFLSEVSFKVDPGNRVAILGSNASGKSTLVDLIYGIKEPSRGTLVLDGRDYRDISPETLRDQITLIRGVELLPDSIFENVRAGRQHLNTDDVRIALEQAGILEEVQALEEGMQTQLGSDGSPLSVTQARALVLARAIVGKPRLLLVDESLDELDEQSREAALRVLMDDDAPWTLILSTNDNELAKRFERTVSLEQLKSRRSA